jgi:DNA damage-inducible protein 1
MELTFVTDLGQSFVVDIDPTMELENVMALLEAEVSRSSYRRTIDVEYPASVWHPHRRAKHFL